MGKFLGWIGAVVTVAYLAGLAWLTSGRLSALRTMELNSVGDFMAGAFGPLAILWLVLGYFQQGIELRQNSEALRMQAQELKNSVEQQSELVKVAQAQLDSDRAALEHQRKLFEDQEKEANRKAQPLLTTAEGYSHGGGASTHDIYFKNYGAVCRNFSLKVLDTDWEFSPSEYPILEKTDRSLKFSVTLPTSLKESQFLAEISFSDARGNMQIIPCQGYLSLKPGASYTTMKINIPEV